jgi:hypothetical protein
MTATANKTLTVLLRRGPDGPLIWREPVTQADLADLVSELWLHAYLRKGQTSVPLEDVRPEVVPQLHDPAMARCAGFSLEVTHADGQKIRRYFSLISVAHVARRTARLLRESGSLSPGTRFIYEVEMTDGDRVPAPADSDLGFDIKIERPPLTHLRVPLAPLLAQAKVMEKDEADDCPVFFTRAAFAKAERCSRRGAKLNPPVETGGVLAGHLCASPCGEFFVVVTDVLEATDALETPYSLGFSDQTWNRIQAVVQARQSAHPEQGYRLLGNCHGHNFLPNLTPTASDPASCQTCPRQKTCSITSVFCSESDELWIKSLFARQPWHLTNIFGLTPRSEPVHGLFGLRDGRLQPRGFHLIPDFPL